MGVLDSIFVGDTGVVATISKTLGGNAVVKIAVDSHEEKNTGRIVYEYKDYEVSFIPSDANQKSNVFDGGSRNVENIRSGSFPMSDDMIKDSVEPRVARDFIVLDGSNFRFETLDKTYVGNFVAQFSFTATR